MLKSFSRVSNRDIYIFTKSPPQQYSSFEVEIKEIGEEIKPLSDYENAIIAFDDTPGSSYNRYTDQFFIKDTHKYSDICYLSQSYFELPKKIYKKNY